MTLAIDAFVTAHRVVDQHPLKSFDVFLQRLALCGHDRLHFVVISHQKDAMVPDPRLSAAQHVRRRL